MQLYKLFKLLCCRAHIPIQAVSIIRQYINYKVKWSRYRPGVAQRVGRGIALLFHDRGTRRGWVVSSTPQPHFTPGKDPVPILQEAGWDAGPVWTDGKSRPHRDSIPDRPAHSRCTDWATQPTHKLYGFFCCLLFIPTNALTYILKYFKRTATCFSASTPSAVSLNFELPEVTNY